MMPTNYPHEFSHPTEWLNATINRLQQNGRTNLLADMMRDMARTMDGDTIQDLFQSDMEEDGYFVPQLPGGELVRSEERNGLTVELYDLNQTMEPNHHAMAYRLLDGDEVIAQGRDFGVPKGDSVDDDEALAGLLNLMSEPQPSDNYTPAQTEWIQNHKEDLQMWSSELRGEDNE